MSLPHVNIPKFTALFSHALAIKRLRELEPIADALCEGNLASLTGTLSISRELIQSIAHDIRSNLAAINRAPDLPIGPNGQDLDHDFVNQYFGDSRRVYQSVHESLNHLRDYRRASPGTLHLLEHLEELTTTISEFSPAELTKRVRFYVAGLQTVVRGLDLQIVPDYIVNAEGLRWDLDDQSFFNSLWVMLVEAAQ